MDKKINDIRRRRSRAVTKPNIKTKIKKNKTIVFIVIFIFLILVLASIYITFSNFENNNSISYDSSYKNDLDYKSALASTFYPVAILETSKGVIAVELYDDQAPITCENFIKLVNDGFYDGMIFHRIMNDFIIQTGDSFSDGSFKTSPYGNLDVFEGDVSHVDGAISMANIDIGTPGGAQFFLCDGAQTGLDGEYIAFGKTIYGISVVQDIADEPHDSRYWDGNGGKPINDIIVQRIYIAKE
jgi:cyclophilin family peptidyl-prolyl cis-trans isomerase